MIEIKRNRVLICLALLAVILMAGACMMPVPGNDHNEIPPEEEPDEERSGFNSNLPLVVIDTNGAAIVDEPKIPALLQTFDRQNDRNYTSDTPACEERIAIEFRGSTSLGFPKKSYAIEIQDQYCEDLDVSLLGLPAESDWVLYGPYSDKTLLRNYLACALTRETGRYASRTVFVELLFKEGDEHVYKGVYLLMEKIKRGDHRVDIARLAPCHNSEPEISGGYILKIDRRDDEIGFKTERRVSFLIDYPQKKFITPEQTIWIKDYIQRVEAALFSSYYTHPVIGYRRYIDTGSWIDYMLLREFFRDDDTYILSTFLHKKRDGTLCMGPVWDFNLSMGNCMYGYKGRTDGWQLDRRTTHPGTFWWQRLLRDPAFREALVERWRALRQTTLSTDHIFDVIDDAVFQLEEAQQRNFQRWPVLGQYVWPNPAPYPQTYEEEIANLKEWLRQRAAWMDEHIDTLR